MENADHRWDFFLAHAGADTEPASTLYELLAPQAQVFLDALSLQPGDVWDTALSAAQRQSLMTVVLISARTDRAYYQREEIASAIALARDDPSKHRVVPVYLDGLTAEDSRVPYGLRLRHGLTAHGADGLASVASRLLGLLGQLTGRSFDRSPESATPAEPSERTDTRAEPLLTKETIVSRSETSIVRRGRHAVHGDVLVKDLLSIPDESLAPPPSSPEAYVRTHATARAADAARGRSSRRA